MERCPNCGQMGSIDAIALASGAWDGLRCQRCAACEYFWAGKAELEALGEPQLWEAAGAPSGRLCRVCGGVMKALPELEGVYSCEACRFVLMDERTYDEL
ncbi:MAG: hypothetical protein HY926_15495 [Elusimicrobia bacterium]|nr:hypothetical protein [Elusimicrobiota bacterium]